MLEVAALFGFEDHPFAGAVLYRLDGIQKSLPKMMQPVSSEDCFSLISGVFDDRLDDVFIDGSSFLLKLTVSFLCRDPKRAADGTSRRLGHGL